MNISHINDCYGCGLCAIVCSRKIINIEHNNDGFYEPHIVKSDKCTDCGLCTEVCAYIHDDIQVELENIKGYAAWSKDMAVRRKCSSGGIGFELGRYLLGKEYKVCGVRYNVEKARAEHFVAISIEELVQSIGSKYIQSYTVDGFREVNRKEKYLITGTPCQIASFRRYIRKFKIEENFVLMDFFCHGVPSMLMWQKYITSSEMKLGKLTYVAWRHKANGWHDSWNLMLDGEKYGEPTERHGSYQMLIKEKKSFLSSRWSQGDSFYNLFLGDYCLGKACYEMCHFKCYRSAADIRIGDLWGKTYEGDDKGVNGVLTFTEKGDKILHALNCELTEHSLTVVCEGQMKESPIKTPLYDMVMTFLRDPSISIEYCNKTLKLYVWRQRQKHRFKHPFVALQEIFHRILTILKW